MASMDAYMFSEMLVSRMMLPFTDSVAVAMWFSATDGLPFTEMCTSHLVTNSRCLDTTFPTFCCV